MLTKKQKKNRHKRDLRKRKQAFAAGLESNVPKSELWFRELYKAYALTNDEYNTLFGGFIPDIINRHYKYIIEVDGSIHELEHIKKKDIKKDNRYKGLGYRVIRVQAYNIESFNEAVKTLCRIRGKNYKPAKIFTKEEIAALQATSDGTVNNV